MRTTKNLLLMLILMAGLHGSASAGIAIRGGAMFPRGDFKQIAAIGGRGEISVDLGVFRLPFMSTVLSFSKINFSSEELTYDVPGDEFTQKSKVSVTGGGAGLRLSPPSPTISPFAEAVIRLASIEQDYNKGFEGSSRDSFTKLGYQINVGLSFAFAPKLRLETGATWMTFPNCEFQSEQAEFKTDLQSIGLFAGLSLGIGI